jgi:hypothetical protein
MKKGLLKNLIKLLSTGLVRCLCDLVAYAPLPFIKFKTVVPRMWAAVFCENREEIGILFCRVVYRAFTVTCREAALLERFLYF